MELSYGDTKVALLAGVFLPSTARSMMVGRVFPVLTGACQFGNGCVGGFTTNFIHSSTGGGVSH